MMMSSKEVCKKILSRWEREVEEGEGGGGAKKICWAKKSLIFFMSWAAAIMRSVDVKNR